MNRKKRTSIKLIILILLSLNLPLVAEGTISSFQSTDRPFGLDIVGPVYEAASDADSLDFQTNYLPEIQEILQNNLSENTALSSENLTSLSLDPSKLDLTYDSDVRVYFVGEGAGYHNSLGFNDSGSSIDSGNPLLIFPDASHWRRDTTEEYPVNPGDFVDIGSFTSGTSLDFFLIADGADNPIESRVFSTDISANQDGIQHVVSFAVEDSSYLILGFEDIYNGGDQDYNDLMFAVDIGQANVQTLIETSALVPEPEEIFMMIIFGLFLVKHLITQQSSQAQIKF